MCLTNKASANGVAVDALTSLTSEWSRNALKVNMRHREGNAFAREFRRQRKGIRVTGGERLPLLMVSSHPKGADRVDDRPGVQPKHGRARDLSGRDLPDYLPLRKLLPFSRRTIDRGIHAAYNRFRIRGVYNRVRVYFRDGIPNDYEWKVWQLLFVLCTNP